MLRCGRRRRRDGRWLLLVVQRLGLLLREHPLLTIPNGLGVRWWRLCSLHRSPLLSSAGRRRLTLTRIRGGDGSAVGWWETLSLIVRVVLVVRRLTRVGLPLRAGRKGQRYPAMNDKKSSPVA